MTERNREVSQYTDNPKQTVQDVLWNNHKSNLHEI